MKDQLVHLSLQGPARKAVTVLPLVVALAAVWFSSRWFIGNTIAGNISADDRGLENAQLAVNLAPSDPLAHWTLAEIEQSKLPLDQSNHALVEYEQAVKLAPHDYRFWLAWGRALEQADDIKGGEQAMRRAVELAPSYSYPRWYLGNLLLRDGRSNEAFEEFRRASDADPQLRGQVFNLIWQVYGKDAAQLAAAIGPDASRRAEFAKYLVERNLLEPGLNLWRSLSATEKEANSEMGATLITTLANNKQYPHAFEVWNDLLKPAGSAHAGEVLNGGFEQDSRQLGDIFGWQLRSNSQAQTTYDRDVRHGGAQSLRIIFKAKAKVEFGLSQLVVVQPGAQYDFEGFYRTSKLESGATPMIEIADAIDGAVLATGPAATVGINDWQRISFPFKAGAKTEAVIIRLNRASCGEDQTCPIFGTVWYDDFNIKRRG